MTSYIMVQNAMLEAYKIIKYTVVIVFKEIIKLIIKIPKNKWEIIKQIIEKNTKITGNITIDDGLFFVVGFLTSLITYLITKKVFKISQKASELISFLIYSIITFLFINIWFWLLLIILTVCFLMWIR